MFDLTMKTSVVAALRQGDMKRATEIALDALKSGQQDALYLNLRAQLLEVHGRNREAMADLEAAHALEPRNTGVLEALGLLRLRLVQVTGARDAFQCMVEVAPDYAHAHFCLGLAHAALGDTERAMACFKRADTMEPGRSQTLARIASVAAVRGEWDEARRYAALALERNPREFDARFVIAAADLDEGKAAAVVEQLRPLAADPALPPAERATASSVIGDALDAQGDTDGAFQAYSDAGTRFVEAYTQFRTAKAYEQIANLHTEFGAATKYQWAPPQQVQRRRSRPRSIGFPLRRRCSKILSNNPRVATAKNATIWAASSLLRPDDRSSAAFRNGRGRFRRAIKRSRFRRNVPAASPDKLPTRSCRSSAACSPTQKSCPRCAIRATWCSVASAAASA
jgi:tetratricopeptide (TPR) repeat protein